MNKPRIDSFARATARISLRTTVDYPRDGLYLFGPVDAGNEPRQVRYGVIGTPASLRRFKEWSTQVSKFINVPPPGRMSKMLEPHHVAFPWLQRSVLRIVAD